MLGDYNMGNYEVNEAYRSIRTYLSINNNLKTILVTSAEINEGKTTLVCNLAKCFANLDNKKILLIDCDFRKKSVSKYLDINNENGIADVILGKTTMEESIKHIDSLDILTCGAEISNSSEILESETMKDLLDTLKENYDYIFIDSPPICKVNDAIIISTYVDGTLIINAAKSLKGKMAKATREKLEKVNANVIGVILNKAKSRENKYYKYDGYEEESNSKFFHLINLIRHR